MLTRFSGLSRVKVFLCSISIISSQFPYDKFYFREGYQLASRVGVRSSEMNEGKIDLLYDRMI